MADSPISSLDSVDNIEPDDLFVLEHTSNGQRRACKLRGEQVTQYVSRNVVAYNGSIVPSNAAGGANYDPDTQTLTLVLPHGPGFETVVPGASRAATEEEVSTLEGTVTTYDLMSEEVRLTNPDSTIPSQKIGEIRVYNGRNGTGLVNSVMNVGPTSGTTNVPAEKLFNLIYPVGSIYISVNSTSPATLFGGSWERIQDTFLMAAGTNHAAGTTHTNNENISLSKSQLPNEQISVGYHIINASKGSSALQSAISGGRGIVPALYKSNASCGISQTHDDIVSWKYGNADGDASATLTTDSINGGVTQQAIDIAPTYLTVYMWKRTALAT